MNAIAKLKRSLGLSVAGALALGLGLAPAASADTQQQRPEVAASDDFVYTHMDNQVRGYLLRYKLDPSVEDGEVSRWYATQLFSVDTPASGPTIGAYCLQMDAGIRFGATGKLEDWNTYTNSPKSTLAGNVEGQNKINWIVANSYPEKSLEEVAEAIGVRSLTPEEAITGTQAAIWSISHEIEFDWTRTFPDAGQGPILQVQKDKIKQLAEYLLGENNTGLDFYNDDRAYIKLTAEAHPKPIKVDGGYDVGTVDVAMKNIESVDSLAIHAESLDGLDFTLLGEDGEEIKDGDHVRDNDQLTVIADEKIEEDEDFVHTVKFWTDAVEEKSVTGGLVQPTLNNLSSQAIVLVGEAKIRGEAELSFSLSGKPETPEEPEEPETPEQPEEPEEEEETPEVTPAPEPEDSDDNGGEQPQAQKDSGDLAKTGADKVWALGAAGLLLIGAGAGLYFIRRRA